MRDNEWLENRIEYIQRKHFADAKIANALLIRFGRRARRVLGSIRKNPERSILDKLAGNFDTQIIINGHFRDERIPEFMVDSVIGHELCHYVHGFSSPLPQLARHPHKGGIVNYEMAKRGLGELELKQKRWIKKYWLAYLRKHR
jgi:hypothetical protein